MKTFKVVISSYQTIDICHAIDIEILYKNLKMQIDAHNKNITKLTQDNGFKKAIISIEEVEAK